MKASLSLSCLLLLRTTTGFAPAATTTIINTRWDARFSYTATTTTSPPRPDSTTVAFASTIDGSQNDPLPEWMTARLPTSVEDQVRQATLALQRASADDGIHRHSIRLLLPIIGATELDDWPGGARQMMQAANPLLENILTNLKEGKVEIQQSPLDDSDGLYAIMGQAVEGDPVDDTCCIPLPSADNVQLLRALDPQVGPKRDMIFCNTQWKRRTDFGNFGIGGASQVEFVESFQPTFYVSNLMVDGDQIRILRAHPGDWRVFLLVVEDAASEQGIKWVEIGTKQYVASKPSGWDDQPSNKRDGGRLFDYGQPSYQEIAAMIQAAPGYRLKSYAERAAAAFTFIKDTL